MRLDVHSVIPSPAEWLIIIAFIIGAVALIPQYVVLSTQGAGYLALMGAILTLLLKVLTTEVPPPVA